MTSTEWTSILGVPIHDSRVTQLNDDIAAMQGNKQDTLTDSDKQAIADLHADKVTSVNGLTGAVSLTIPTVSNDYTDDDKSHVTTMWSDWSAMDASLTALEGVI